MRRRRHWPVRAGDEEPTVPNFADIFGADLVAWYDAGQGITGGSNPTAWADLSGNGHDLSAVGTLTLDTIDGRPAVRSGTGRMEAALGPGWVTGTGTVILVMKHRTGGTSTGTLVLSSAGQNDFGHGSTWLVGSNAQPTISNYHQSQVTSIGGTLPLDVALISRLTGTAQTALTGLGASASTPTGSTLAPDSLHLFARVLLGTPGAWPSQDIAIAEAAVVCRSATTEEIDAVWDYLRPRFPSLVA